jgi:ElaB/YqjD/DUF883 family membrane-anchored ribosome-binding protein
MIVREAGSRVAMGGRCPRWNAVVAHGLTTGARASAANSNGTTHMSDYHDVNDTAALRRAANQTSDTIEEASETVQTAIDESAAAAVGKVSALADQASELAAKAGEHAQRAYSQVAGRAQDAADIIDPFVQERPYAALAITAGIGLVVGLLMAGRGPRIIYVDGYRD